MFGAMAPFFETRELMIVPRRSKRRKMANMNSTTTFSNPIHRNSSPLLRASKFGSTSRGQIEVFTVKSKMGFGE